MKTCYWELWKEPNMGYWQGTTEEYIKLYDYTAGAVKRALPAAKIGDPYVTGPSWEVSNEFLMTFLDHVLYGKNHITGETGAPLDYIGFHTKGSPGLVNSVVKMNIGTQLRDISDGFEIVSSYPELKHPLVIIGESDPEGCAACSIQDYPANAYRNGTIYSSYTAASFARKYDLADHFGVNFKGAVTWTFEFENQPWFNGYRDLATNGVYKPVLNVFRMFGMVSGNRVEVSGNLAYDYISICNSSVRGERTDVSALAAINSSEATILVWNYHDLNITGLDSSVDILIEGITAKKALLKHYRIDQDHSNAYEVWKNMGSPQNPTVKQYAELEESGKLMMLHQPEKIRLKNGRSIIKMELPRKGVSLLKLTW